ncbi:MAG: hypothetical protein HOK30_13570 [Rhodospirillaceae bacterium]|jgi:hypothetical protein|nr:hypothetical protein [Rhodospirillaceae bacterium]MBT5195701.1 hypothetical protein [Rhodospirillaceae bacterium]MBT5895278.1 hypothetical protein [Rhodospirillaceae bacterium]MBT6428690.1 hypothetical protein [Rhodospirillaceae bacterium]MBT7759788.1 hypothetical protein [Rhodospirillaceae bacterium]
MSSPDVENRIEDFKDKSRAELEHILNNPHYRGAHHEAAGILLERLDAGDADERQETLRIARASNDLAGEANDISKTAKRISWAAFAVAVISLVVTAFD